MDAPPFSHVVTDVAELRSDHAGLTELPVGLVDENLEEGYRSRLW